MPYMVTIPDRTEEPWAVLNDTLAHCPFCGVTPKLERRPDERWVHLKITCMKCLVTMMATRPIAQEPILLTEIKTKWATRFQPVVPKKKWWNLYAKFQSRVGASLPHEKASA